jgi:hypothetical protein
MCKIGLNDIMSVQGGTVVRPVWHEFPRNQATPDIGNHLTFLFRDNLIVKKSYINLIIISADTQFMWGPALMVSPVIEQGATGREVRFVFGDINQRDRS